MSFFKTNNFHRAIYYYKKSIEADPQSPKDFHALGHALDKTKKYNEAIECWRKTIQLQPNCWKALRNIGLAL